MHKQSTGAALAAIDEIRALLQRAEFAASGLQVMVAGETGAQLLRRIQEVLAAAQAARAELQKSDARRRKRRSLGALGAAP